MALAVPGGAVSADRVDGAVRLLESRGLLVRVRPDITSACRYLAGDDRRRREELLWALRDPEIRAVFLARGGYGTQRVLNSIASEDLGTPRAVVGFSDNTALLEHLRQRGWAVLHGPHPRADHPDELDSVLEGRDIVALAIQSFDDLGFDIRPIVAVSDLLPGDPETSKKCQHAFCMSVDAPRDVRILCNIASDKRWMGTTLHEFGHGIYASSLDPALPYVLRDDPHTLC
ncbi:MAG: LD-carboxypeptidase, partial [Proteobacteria bacterium]|nr:LD-carboxypeptidase [Pseudomonadota bacterium]